MVGYIGLRRAGSRGGGASAAPELVADSDYDTGVGWIDVSLGTAVPTFAASEVSLPRPDGSNIARIRQVISTEIGKTYTLRTDASVSTIKFGVGTSALDDSLLDKLAFTGQTIEEDFVATTTSTHIYVIGTTNGTTPKSSFLSIKKS